MKTRFGAYILLLVTVSCGNEADGDGHSAPNQRGACGEAVCTNANSCDGITCSNHGSCRVSESGVVGCDCADGYRANNVECVPVETLNLNVGDGTSVSVSRVGSVVTLEEPVPTAFPATLRVTAVQRNLTLIGSKSELIVACKEPLSLVEISTPPRYALEGLLANPLNTLAIQTAINPAVGGLGIALTNPLTIESILASESTLQPALDAMLGTGILSSVERLGLPTSEYSWSFLCGAAAADGSAPFLTLTIRGRLGEVPYEGTIAFNDLVLQ